MGDFLEALMILLFGLSWPVSILKSYRSRTAKGKSAIFLCFIFFGYVVGVASKIVTDNINYVVIFYCLNLIMVGADFILYFRNRKLDKQNER